MAVSWGARANSASSLAAARAVAGGMAFMLTVAGCAGAPVDTGAAGEASLVELGRTVFLERAEPSCALCHTLADAGAGGVLGPDLDALRPGLDVMPPQARLLTEEEIRAVARYVVDATGGG